LFVAVPATRPTQIDRGNEQMSRQLAKALVLALAAVIIAACTSGTPNTSSNNKFSGVTVRVLTFTGPQIAEPLQRRGPEFERLTGAKIAVITVPFSDLYQKLLTDFATKTNSYDATVFDPQWMGDYVSCLAMKRSAQSYWMYSSIASAFIQSQGTKQGAFFDTNNMQPLYNNPAAAKGLGIYKTLSKLGPPDQLNNDVGDSRGLFVTGRCALSLDWGDIGPLAVDKTQS